MFYITIVYMIKVYYQKTIRNTGKKDKLIYKHHNCSVSSEGIKQISKTKEKICVFTGSYSE